MDSFGVGVTYGIRKMKITYFSISLIAFCSAMVLLASMNVGTILSTYISGEFAETIGGVLLILLGFFVLWPLFKSKSESTKQKEPYRSPSKYIWNKEIRSLGIVIQILRSPDAADIDRSGTITGLEALLLGIALSLDSFAAGIGASLLGFPHLQTALIVAIMSSVFLIAGMKVGQLFSSVSFIRLISYLPGVLLVILGVLKL